MRLYLFILGVFAALVCIAKPAAAQDYPWCAYYDIGGGGGGGATNCGWATLEQCLATVSGIGGSCGPNPMYPAPAGTISVDWIPEAPSLLKRLPLTQQLRQPRDIRRNPSRLVACLGRSETTAAGKRAGCRAQH